VDFSVIEQGEVICVANCSVTEQFEVIIFAEFSVNCQRTVVIIGQKWPAQWQSTRDQHSQQSVQWGAVVLGGRNPGLEIKKKMASIGPISKTRWRRVLNQDGVVYRDNIK